MCCIAQKNHFLVSCFFYNLTNIHHIYISRQIFYQHPLQRLRVSWYVLVYLLWTFLFLKTSAEETEEIMSLLTCVTKFTDVWTKSHDDCFFQPKLLLTLSSDFTKDWIESEENAIWIYGGDYFLIRGIKKVVVGDKNR